LQSGKVRATGTTRSLLGDVVGDHIVVIPASTPGFSEVELWLQQHHNKPARVLEDWHIALEAIQLAAFVAAFPTLRYEVRPPTLDDLFLALGSESPP
jgi:lipooligosaccharide transport system ATP-binding protein